MDNKQMEEFIAEHIPCPTCGKNNFTPIRKFNLMFKTFQGVNEDTASEIFLRPETAQEFSSTLKMCCAAPAAKCLWGSRR